MSIVRLIVVILLMGLLTACSAGGPGRDWVEKAIALQLQETQQALGNLLYNDPASVPEFTIRRIKITQNTPFKTKQQMLYRVNGTYDIKLVFPDHETTQRYNPFEVYLQYQPETKNWQLTPHPTLYTPSP